MNNKRVKISDLGTPEKSGSVVMPGSISGSDPIPLASTRERIRAGGFIIFGGDKRSVKNAAEELSSISGIPLYSASTPNAGGQILSTGRAFLLRCHSGP
jgi:hypothetical protein